MIDSFNLDRTGWARFSDDMTMRYRLARCITPRAVGLVEHSDPAILSRVVFVMLNPSTADAFKPDNTVSRCIEFARRWGADVVEVVNLFAFRSTYPKDLRTAADRGDGPENDGEILTACRGATRVIAAWGRGGEAYGRDVSVRSRLASACIDLEALRLTADGVPMHPLARGKSWIPYDVVPEKWA